MNPFFSSSPGEGFSFGSPAWLTALFVLLPLIWFFIDAARRRGILLSRIVAPRLQASLTGQVSSLKRNLRTASLLLSIALAITGLAKPRLGSKELEVRSKGRDVILAVDTSRSMLSTDTAPTRLGRAKLIGQDLLFLLKGDRVGLIAFAGNAFLQAPLTLDKGAVLTSLGDLDTSTIPRGGTDIAAAIRMAIAAFGKGEGTSRALVLMTDGEDLEASGVEAAKEASAAGIRIFTIGFGSAAGSLIPVRTEEGRNDFVRDESGRPVTSKLDAARLTEIAKETGGFYQPYGQDAAQKIYEKGILPMEEKESGTFSSRKPIERYAWPVTGALVLLALWSLLGEGRRVRNALPLLFLLTLVASGTLSASGLGDYQQGNYQGALKDFEGRLQSGAKAPEVTFDAGAAAYKAGDYAKAAGYFSTAMTAGNAKIRNASTYNLANSLVRTGEAAKENEVKLSDWKNALQHYATVLKSEPSNAAAKENSEIVRKLIEDLKKQQEQQKKDQKNDKNQKNDQKDKKDQKDQNKEDQSRGQGNDKKDQKDPKDQQEQKDQQGKNDQKQDQQSQKNQNQNQDPKNKEAAASPTPSPSPSPEEGKGNEAGQENKDQQEQKDQKNQQGKQGKDQGQRQQQPGQQQGAQPTPSPASSPKKQGDLGGGEQGDKKDQQAEAAAEAEEGKDGKMSPNQARALLRSLQDEEQHVLNQQHRAVEQTLRDW